MQDYRWSTEEPHADNQTTMSDYLDSEMDPSWEVTLVDGTYAEIVTDTGEEYEVHAMGDGNFNDHRVKFIRINR